MVNGSNQYLNSINFYPGVTKQLQRQILGNSGPIQTLNNPMNIVGGGFSRSEKASDQNQQQAEEKQQTEIKDKETNIMPSSADKSLNKVNSANQNVKIGAVDDELW